MLEVHGPSLGGDALGTVLGRASSDWRRGAQRQTWKELGNCWPSLTEVTLGEALGVKQG
jgi:hypothetical protein